jgi:transglutaminase-like putative cysteine protease
MPLATVFRLSLYGLTAFASWMLGRAEDGWIPFVTFPVLVAAFVLTESRGNWALPASVANLLGALAVMAAGYEFFQEGPLSKLLSGAHLLVYATWIVMFQEKTIRNYWWLMGLGILQIAVTSVQATEANPSFGPFLTLYVCGALWTMCIAALYQAQLQFAGVRDFNQPAPDVMPAERRVLQYDGRERWITGRLVGGVIALTGLSLFVSAVFFAFTPRIWVGPQKIFGDESLPGGTDEQRRTGFAESVKLGEIGAILESVKTVMEVRPYDALTEQPVDLFRVADRLGMDEPLFRGLVLAEYEGGQWIPERADRRLPLGRTFHQPGYRIDVVLEPMNSEVLFALGVPEACKIDREREVSYVNQGSGMLSRHSRPETPERLGYSLSVRPLDPELARIHATMTPRSVFRQIFDNSYVKRNQRLPASGLERLRQLSRKTVAEAEQVAGRELTDHERAVALEHHLRDSGEYGYTLNLTVQDRNIDPVEDFLFLRKEGHCEYFATALALMLRAEGIPARVISGFKGAERNSIIGCWEVQERHAHLWVEALVKEDQWVTLDPTPGQARSESVAEVGNRVGFWGRMRATTTSLWTDYVVNVNLTQQRRQLYGPLSDFIVKLGMMVQQAIGWGPVIWAYLQYLLLNPAEWFSVYGVLTALVLLTSVYLLARLCKRVVRKLRNARWLSHWSRRRQQMLVVAFYDRYLKVVRRQGLRRAPAETPQEFAAAVVMRLREFLSSDGLADVPDAVCTAYYRVRFGGEMLASEELQHLEQRLSRFEGELRHKHRH